MVSSATASGVAGGAAGSGAEITHTSERNQNIAAEYFQLTRIPTHISGVDFLSNRKWRGAKLRAVSARRSVIQWIRAAEVSIRPDQKRSSEKIEQIRVT